MNAVTRLLINVAEAALWLWDALWSGLVWIGRGLDVVLNALLSPILALLNPLCTTIGDGVYAVLWRVPLAWQLTFISLLTGVVMLVAFRYTSNQKAIGRARDDIKAHLLALKLFKDELAVVVKSQLRLIGAIFRLQRYVLTPVLIMLLPMLLVLGQMGLRHQWRPLRPGEQTLVRLQLSADSQVDPLALRLDAGVGADVEVGPLPGDEDVVWRIRAATPGRHLMRIHHPGGSVEKELVVGEVGQRVNALRSKGYWLDRLLHPAERALPRDSGVSAVAVEYPGLDSWFSGSDWWVLTFFILSMAAALAFKPFFRVRF